MMKALVLIFSLLLPASAGLLFAAQTQDSKAPPAAVPLDFEKLSLFKDPDAGYSMRVPEGFARLSDEENRQVFRGITEYMGKQAGERALRRPPAWFKGPADPTNAKLPPPSLAIGYTDLTEPVDPTQMSRYKEELEEAFRKQGEKFGDFSVALASVGGVTSLRIEREIVSVVDGSHGRVVNLAVPGNGRRYDIVFNYSPEQAAHVQPAIETVTRTFRLESALLDPQTKSKWTRILIWTIGGFIVGIVLSLLLRVLAGVGDKPDTPTKQ
ncbi:MAG TPA: hypothetical protein VGP72_30695 [Planctomycetota bacterium]|jgi:hypothetical protein